LAFSIEHKQGPKISLTDSLTCELANGEYQGISLARKEENPK